jgi:hypothetical protein
VGSPVAESEQMKMSTTRVGVCLAASRNSRSIQQIVLMSIVFLYLALAHAGMALAQLGAGAIAGTVTDPKGLVVPSADVTIHNTDTGVDRTLTTNDAGNYVAPFLPTGHYEVTAGKQGFAKTTRKELTLQVGQTLTIDVQLPVEGSTTTVEVTAEVPLLEPEKVESSEVVSQNLVENLPINGRRWTDFVLLTPGVSTDGGFGLVSYRGISSLYNNNTVDGADNNQAFFSEARGRTRAAYIYSMQTIKEFQVTDSNYSAEFGRAAGGIVNAVTKSGTNQFHGSGFWFLRQFHGVALDPFLKAQGNFTKSELIRHQFGGDFGGPIKKDKLFFYAAYDGQRRSFPVGISPSSGTYFTATATPGNCPAAASAAQCNAAISYLQSLTGSYARTGNQDIVFGKLEYEITQNNRLSGSINWQNWNSPNGFLTSMSTSSALSNNGKDSVRSRFVIGDLSSVLTSSMTNDFRFQYGQDLEFDTPSGGGPAVSLTSGLTYGLNTSLPRTFYPDERRYQFTEAVSMIHGAHSIKAGVDVNLIHEKLANLFQGGGTYSYSGNATTAFQNWILDVYQISSGATTGRHYNSFTQAADPITGVGADDFWNNNYGAFVQDTWKVRPTVTVNIGLRYDIQLVPQPPRPNNTTALAAQLSSSINIDKNNFGPRISVSWQMNPKTLARIGYGLYFGQTSNSTFYALRVENGVFQQTFSFSNPTSAGAPMFPNLIFTPPGPAPASPFSGAAAPAVVNTNPALSTQTIRGLTADFVNPVVHMGELVLERELGWRSSISASYLMSRGLRLPSFTDANLAPTSATKTYDITDSTGATVSTVTVPFYTTRASATGIILNGASVVNSWYNGFVLTYKKSLSNGFETLVNYTYSKSIDDGEVLGTNGTFNGTDVPVDPFNQRAEHGLSDLDQRNHLVWSFTYALPFEHASNAIERRALGGISFSGILTLASGRPVTAFMSNTASPSCADNDGGATCGEVSSFGSGTGGRAPQFGRNACLKLLVPTYPSCAGPGITVFDMRAQRDFQIAERFHFALLVEAFNLTNTANITSVSTNAFTYGCNGGAHTNPCIAPFTGQQFLSPTSTSNNLLGARQLQLSAKINF